MSTYIELCNDVNNIIGLQGVISDVTSPRGIQKNIVDAVASSWVDIQTLREDWEFMNAEISSFSTTTDQSVYTPADIFGSAVAATNLSVYKEKRGFFLGNVMLANVDWEDLPFINNEDQSQKPTWFCIDPVTNNLTFQKPDGEYNIVIRYKKAPQILTVSTDTPYLPQQFQNAIVYKAVTRVCAYTGNTGLFQVYHSEGNTILGQLMRSYIRTRRVYPRNFLV